VAVELGQAREVIPAQFCCVFLGEFGDATIMTVPLSGTAKSFVLQVLEENGDEPLVPHARVVERLDEEDALELRAVLQSPARPAARRPVDA
jgi:hypothetical protein